MREKFNVPAILRMIESMKREVLNGGDRNMIELVVRLIVAQQAEIESLRKVEGER